MSALLAAAAARNVWTRFADEQRDDPELRAIGLRAAADANEVLGRRAIAEQQRAEAARLDPPAPRVPASWEYLAADACELERAVSGERIGREP